MLISCYGLTYGVGCVISVLFDWNYYLRIKQGLDLKTLILAVHASLTFVGCAGMIKTQN